MAHRSKPIIIIQGGQYGSEAKGLIAAKVGRDRQVHMAIRTGTVNAGHTVYHEGKPYAMQQLPVGWVDPECELVLGPGAYINPEILAREIGWVEEAFPQHNVRDRLRIDVRCGIHLGEHTRRSTDSGRHHAMGATGKGSSEAVIDKINGRGRMTGLASSYGEWLTTPDAELFGLNRLQTTLCDTVRLVNMACDIGQQLLIEGTQGTLLDLHLGQYPYVTHKQTQAANWMAEAGLSVTLPTELVLVMRTFPIRVAGNSGPLPQECSWLNLGGWINQKLILCGLSPRIEPNALAAWRLAVESKFGQLGDPAHWTDQARNEHRGLASEGHRDCWTSLTENQREELKRLFEMTTVTKKLRRVGQWNWEDARRSVMLNRPSSIALTFMNYEFPEAWGATRIAFSQLPITTRQAIYRYVREREQRLGVPVSYIGFGPLEENTIRLYHDELEGSGMSLREMEMGK